MLKRLKKRWTPARFVARMARRLRRSEPPVKQIVLRGQTRTAVVFDRDAGKPDGR